MKTPILILLLSFPFATTTRAADDLTAVLQQALFNEEADHDLAAAIKAYQFVVTGADAQRKLAATAVFRLGECYRKLSRTNDAIAQYQRIVDQFTDQTNLVTLSRQNLGSLRLAEPLAVARNAQSPAQIEAQRLLIERLELEIKTAEAEVAGYKELIRQKHVPANSADKVQVRLLDLRRQLILARDAGSTGTADGAAAADAPLQNFSPAARAQLKELLQGEIAVASQLLADQRKRVQVGSISSEETWRFERDVLGLNRQLLAVDGLASAEDRKRWRDILIEEIALAEKAVQNERAKLEAGKSIASELAKLQRDVFALKRELVTFDAAAVQSASTVLREAAATDEEEDEIRRIQALIKDSPDLLNASSTDWTPLHQAASKGQLVVARFLLENGANVDQKTSDNRGPAVLLAAERGHKSMVNLLLASGANPNVKEQWGKTALHEAAAKGFVAVVEVLLASKADLEARNNAGETPLHLAISTGRSAAVETLLKRGADINARRNNGDTPLHFAAARGDAGLVVLLLNGKADINAKNRSGVSPLWTALDQGHVEAAEALLKNGADIDFVVGGESPVHRAVRRNSIELVQVLLEHKARPDLRNREGLTPLQSVVVDERAPRPNPELIPLLTKAGANPNEPLPETTTVKMRGPRNVGRFPILVEALIQKDLQKSEALLANKADVNAATPGGYTVLMSAIDSDSEEIVNTVLRYKPELEARTKLERRTALHLAVGKRNLKATEALLKAGAKVDGTDGKGWTPLHMAIEQSNPELVSALLQAGANPNLFADDGTLPLSIARRTSGRTLPGEDTRRELNRLLLQHGADESLLRRRSITVTRRSRNYEQVLFWKGTNDFNRHTLYELIARVYDHGGPQSGERAFPDLRRIAIERAQVGSATRQILVNLEARAMSGVCTNDLWLEWGDLVEIRETEHPLSANWPGLDGTLATNISQCLVRTVNLVIKGRTNRIELRATAIFANQIFGPDGRHLNGYRINQDSFRLAEVLGRSGLLLTSSDLTRVRVRRRDPDTGRQQEWIIDTTKPDQETSLWLRDGDVIEVPEKDGNAAPAPATGAAVVPNDSSPQAVPARAQRRVVPPPDTK